MNRPRLTIAVLRGLQHLCDLGKCDIEAMGDDVDHMYSAQDQRDIARADEWLIAMLAWYMSKEEQS